MAVFTKENEMKQPSSRLSISPEIDQELKSNKRKRNVENGKAASRKAARKSKSGKTRADYDEDIDLEAGINNAFSNMDSQLLADYVAQKTKKFESDLSSVELEDKYLSANAIRDTTSWNKPRNLENLPTFLESVSGNPTKLWSASKKNGSPHTIIVTSAGIRAADLARTLRKFQTKDVKVAKLFAKHIKIAESIKFLKSTRTGIAVGTPTRLRDLMDDGALQLDRLERIVIDASHIDQKKRGILEIRETQIPLTLWLGQKELRERYAADAGAIELIFY